MLLHVSVTAVLRIVRDIIKEETSHWLKYKYEIVKLNMGSVYGESPTLQENEPVSLLVEAETPPHC